MNTKVRILPSDGPGTSIIGDRPRLSSPFSSLPYERRFYYSLPELLKRSVDCVVSFASRSIIVSISQEDDSSSVEECV